MNRPIEIKWFLSWLLIQGQHNTTGQESHQEKGHLTEMYQATYLISRKNLS